MMGARGGFYEAATVRVAPDGSVTAYLGTHNHGQGHSTTFAQILADRLGVPIERISVLEGDTAAVPVGTGTFGSRSIAVGGSALHAACQKVILKGKKIAATCWKRRPPTSSSPPESSGSQARTARLAFGTSRSRRTSAPLSARVPGAGTGRDGLLRPAELRFFQRRACLRGRSRSRNRPGRACLVSRGGRHRDGDQPDDRGRSAARRSRPGHRAGAGGAHGLRRRAASFRLVHGLRAAARDLPRFFSETDESQPCTHNPLGAKGCGESGAIGAPAAVMSALLDALQIEHLEMPATPHAVWRAIMRA